MDGAGAPSSSASSPVTVLRSSSVSYSSAWLHFLLFAVFRKKDLILSSASSPISVVIIICASLLLPLSEEERKCHPQNTILSSQEQFTQPHLLLKPFRTKPHSHSYLHYILPLPLALLAGPSGGSGCCFHSFLLTVALLLRLLGSVTFPNWLKLSFVLYCGLYLYQILRRNHFFLVSSKNRKEAQQGRISINKTVGYHIYKKTVVWVVVVVIEVVWEFFFHSLFCLCELFLERTSSLEYDKSRTDSLKTKISNWERTGVKGILKKGDEKTCHVPLIGIFLEGIKVEGEQSNVYP
jgi:hypothetical protein